MKSRLNRNDAILSLAGLLLYLPAVGRYGAKLEILLLVSLVAGLGVEWLAARMQGRAPRVAGYAAWILLPLALPPAFPLYMSVLSILAAAIVPVAFFGGYGRHMVSPIAFGWAFAALSFPRAFEFAWSYPFPCPLNGFGAWSAALPVVEHPVTFLQAQADVPFSSILRGSFPQPPANAIPAVLLALGIIVVLLRAVAVRTCVAFLLTAVLLPIVFPAESQNGLLHSLFVGDTLFVAFFVLPDTRTSSRTDAGRWLTGALAALVAFLVTRFASSPDGAFFGVLFANVFLAIIDEGVLARAGRRQLRAL